MKNRRSILVDWYEAGGIPPENLRRALTVAGVFPSSAQWRIALDRLMLGLGVLLLSAGVIYFFAYNWDDIGRFTQFGLVQGLVVGCLALVWRLGLKRTGGKAALVAASLFVGVLLALIGQTYQTGADAYELFAVWAALTLPWALAARFALLWLLWLGLFELTVSLYYQAFGGLFGVLDGPEQMLWVLFAINVLALLAWETAASVKRPWLQERWAPRILAAVGAALITALAVSAIVDGPEAGTWAHLAWPVWLGAVYGVYRVWRLDAFILTCGVFSIIVWVTALLGKIFLSAEDWLGMLTVGFAVTALTAAGGWWIKQIVSEDS